MGIDSALLQVVPHSASYKTEVLGERARKAFGNSFFFFLKQQNNLCYQGNNCNL